MIKTETPLEENVNDLSPILHGLVLRFNLFLTQKKP